MEQRAKDEEFKEQKKLLKMKDDMIYKLLEEKKRKEEMIAMELDRETKGEIQQWVALTDNFATELKKYQLVCSFCGVHLDDVAVNTDCQMNPLTSNY
jgi:hypothetical protein